MDGKRKRVRQKRQNVGGKRGCKDEQEMIQCEFLTSILGQYFSWRYLNKKATCLVYKRFYVCRDSVVIIYYVQCIISKKAREI
jgi:hypothetical protein